MKFTYNWLKEFAEIKIKPEVLAHKLTMAGLEVTSLEEKDRDFVFEVEVTSNRPDWLSVMGIAREVAAITNSRLKPQQASGYRLQAKSMQHAAYNVQPISIKIENKEDCPLYTAKIIRGLKVEPSPAWLRKRLELIGLRSVNNIVDITNYILFTYGQPLHTFDLDKLVSKFASSQVRKLGIIVRRGQKGEELITIDGVKRILDEDILIIASEVNEPTSQRANEPTNRPIAIAGIMGSKDTEVTYETKNILLEAAIFNPLTVRRARQRLGLTTESSYRFERGINIEIVEKASQEAAGLIQELCKGKVVLTKGSGKAEAKKKTIILDTLKVNKILGINVRQNKIKEILSNLGFKVRPRTKNKFMVGIPLHRLDADLEIDLIEEVARIFGYENIPKTLPLIRPQLSLERKQDLVPLIKNTLVSLGLNEVITYSLINRDSIDLVSFLKQEGRIIEILNPLSKEQGVLRPTLLPSLGNCINYNLNQKQEDIGIFEIARVFSPEDSQPKEKLVLGIGLCGTKLHLSEQGAIKEEIGIFHLKGIIDILFERLGIREYDFRSKDTSMFNIYIQNQNSGIMTKINLKKEAFLAEISLHNVFRYAQLKKKFMSLPKYPFISRDISFIVKDGIPIKEILAVVKEEAKPLLTDIKIIDYYKGRQIPSESRGITISCVYRSDERTLTEEEIIPLHNQICSALTERFEAKIR